MKEGTTSFQRFSPGEVLFNEGETSREMYILRSGRVQVTIKKDDREIPITELGRGSFVGEMSFIAGIPRTASVTAIEQVYANVIHSDIFENNRYGLPDWIQSIARTLVERIRRTTLMLSDYIAVGSVPAQREKLPQKPKELLSITCKENTVSCSGYFYKNSIDTFKQEVRKLISDEQSVTIDFAGIIDIDREGVEYLKELLNSSRIQGKEIRLRNIQLIHNKLSELKGIWSLIDTHKMKIRSVGAGETLIKAGEKEHNMYVVRVGKLEVFSETEDGTEVPLSIVEAGDVIGEMALIREGQRTANVRSVTDASLYIVEPKDFFHGAYDVPDWFMSVIKGLIERLKNTTEMVNSFVMAQEKEEEDKIESAPLGIIVDAKRPGFIKVQGHLTIENLDFFSVVIRRCMYKGDKDIILDLRKAESMDRSSIRYLLYAYTALKQGGGSMKIIGQKDKILWMYNQKKEDVFDYL